MFDRLIGRLKMVGPVMLVLVVTAVLVGHWQSTPGDLPAPPGGAGAGDSRRSGHRTPDAVASGTADPIASLPAGKASRELGPSPHSYVHITTDSRLDVLMEAAALSSDPDLKAGARWAALICVSMQDDSALPTQAEMRAVLTEDIDYAQLEREVANARQQLAAFCSTGHVDVASLKGSRTGSGLEAGYRYQPFKRAQEQGVSARPWDFVFLSNPTQYPYGVQRVLEHRLKFLVPPEVAESDVALRWVGRTLLEHLTGVPMASQIETARLCWRNWICPARQQPSPDQMAWLNQIERDLEQRIRQQRWAELGLH